MIDRHPRSTLISMYQNRAAVNAKYAALWRDDYLLGRWRWIFDRRRISERVQQFQTLAEIYALTARMLAATALESSSTQLAAIEAERDRLRKALIKAGRNAGGGLADTVSSDFLMHVPEEVSAAIGRIEAERDEARQIVREIHWMALRYVDGRMTYAVSMFNDAVKNAYDAGWLEHNNESPERQYALDGMSPEWRSIEARAEAAESLAKELEALLLPFAAAAEWVAENHPGWDHDRFNIGGALGGAVPFADFRAARARLRTGEKQ